MSMPRLLSGDTESERRARLAQRRRRACCKDPIEPK
jgi:hypothetical protein